MALDRETLAQKIANDLVKSVENWKPTLEGERITFAHAYALGGVCALGMSCAISVAEAAELRQRINAAHDRKVKEYAR